MCKTSICIFATMKAFLISYFWIFFLNSFQAQSQIQIESGCTTGHNQTRDHLYLNPIIAANWQHNDYRLSSGVQFQAADHGHSILKVIKLSGDVRIHVFGDSISIGTGVWYRPFSEYISEYNAVFWLKHERPHLLLVAGNNSRFYKLTNKGESLWPESPMVKEWRNLLYEAGLKLRSKPEPWNITAGISNSNGWLFQQETNFMLYLRGDYNLSKKLKSHLSWWYQPAGSMNLQSDYFGFYLTGGLTWQIFD